MKKLKYIFADWLALFASFALVATKFYNVSNLTLKQFWLASCIAPFLYIFIHYCFKGYSTLFKYMNYMDLLKVIFSSLTNCLIAMVLFLGFSLKMDLYEMLFYFTTSTLLLLSYRIIYSAHPWKKPSRTKKRTLIIGAGEACHLLLSERYRKEGLTNVLGLIDDDSQKQNMHVHGIKVLGKIETLKKWSAMLEIEEVIVAIENISKDTMDMILSQTDLKKTTLKIIAEVRASLFNEQHLLKTRDIFPEDLLGRTSMTFIDGSIKESFKHKTILITGAGGSIGSELCRQLLSLPIKKLHCLTRSEYAMYKLTEKLKHENMNQVEIAYHLGDIRDEQRLSEIFMEGNPDIVLHAAAHKHVPYMERHEKEAIKNNVIGTENVLKMCLRYQTKRFVLVSTDKAVNPPNIMGASKRLAEMLTSYYHKEKGLHAAMVRFGNVIGSRGSVVPMFKKQIEAGGPITVTDPNAVRYFMTIPEAAVLVLHCVAMTKGGERFLLDMGKPIKIDSLVRKMIKLYRFEPDRDIAIEYTGLRPGEKLVEELLTESEKSKKTTHPKIYTAEEKEECSPRFFKELQHFLREINQISNRDVRRHIKRLLPEFSGQT